MICKRTSEYLTRVSMALCALALFATSNAQAQTTVLAPNATISGDLAELSSLREKIKGMSCESRRCHFSVPTVKLTLSIPGYGATGVVFSTVIDPRYVIRESDKQTLNDAETRPILLRGKARLRHAGTRGEAVSSHATGAIFTSNGAKYLEVAIPSRRRATITDRGLMVVRVPLAQSKATPLAGRAQRVSPFALKGATCGTNTTMTLAGSPIDQGASGDLRAQATYEILHMATDFDSSFMSAQGCSSASDCNNKILVLLDRTAVFYERQLGLTLDVARQYGPTVHSSATDASDLLYAFRAYNETNRADAIHDGQNTGENLADLFQLFTGRKMDSNVVGIAFVAVMCENASSAAANMVVSHKSSAANPVITAHEIGHTLNASHTYSGIMTSSLGSSLPTSFNSVSLGEMTSFYSTYKNECRGGTREETTPPSAPPEDTPTPTPTPTGGGGSTSGPKTLQLTATKSGADSYVIKTQVSTVIRGCYVSIRAGTSATSAATGTIIARYNPLVATTTKRGRISASIATSSPQLSTVYLQAEYRCGGSQVIEVSYPVTISPNKGTRSPRKVSRKQWIDLLNKAF